MSDPMILGEALLSKSLPRNSSIRALAQTHNVHTVHDLITALTPAWGTIRGAFTEDDRQHMKYGTEESGPLANPMDLGNYGDVRANAPGILDRVTTADETLRMPPYPAPRWSLDLVLLFRGWIAGGMRP